MEKPWYKLWPDVYPKSLTYYEGSIGDFMEASARRFPERAALIFMGKPMRFRELHDQSLRLAAALADLGVKRETGWPCSCRIAPSSPFPTTRP